MPNKIEDIDKWLMDAISELFKEYQQRILNIHLAAANMDSEMRSTAIKRGIRLKKQR